MKNVRRILSLLLCLAVLSSTLMLSSCMYLLSGERDSDYVTRAELEQMLDGALSGDVTVEGGDNYDITIEGADRTIAAASKSLLSAVSVICSFEVASTGFGSTQTTQAYSAGSGVIYKLDKEQGDAYVITNYHVVYNHQAMTSNKISDNISLYLYGMENAKYAIPATYVGGSMQYDLAVLKIDDKRILAESNAMAATFADSNDVAVLDTAIAVGNPESEGISATVGYVNVDSEYVTLNFTETTGSTEVELRVMRIDTAVNSGNSGGGLYNSVGELIGIVNAKMTDSENIGYAIPSNIVKYVAENILYYCDGKTAETPYRALVGITVTADESYTAVDTETGSIHKREDVIVDSVSAGAVAEGTLQKGDIIKEITIDGTAYEVTRMFHVVDSMLNARAGSEVSFKILREGVETSVSLTIPEGALTKWR
ncbi:MAG: trypsin-like peptidase domain-containing protein [Clostridia bacterium]|nr:trypsin-like peptidase domain-containing protein [Clostridia bacterium]